VTPRNPYRFRERGSTIVMALSAIALVTIFATSMLASVDSASKGVRLDVDRSQAHKYAEGLLEIAEQKLVDDIANFRTLPTPPPSNPLQVMTGTVTIGSVTGTWTITQDVRTIGGSRAPFRRPTPSTR
jgi:Tfp pilus assembly protein PilX